MVRDAGDALGQALTRAAAKMGVALHIRGIRSTRWASATFNGARHDLQASATDAPELSDWVNALPEQEFAIRGHLVADLAIRGLKRAGGRADLALAILTVEDQ